MPVKPLLLFLAVLPLMAQAGNEPVKSDTELPDISFLEFLGSFEEQDNIWLEAVIDETQTAEAEMNKEVKNHE